MRITAYPVGGTLRNSATADVLVTCAITIMKMAGGTSMPIAVPAAIREAESSRL